MTTKINFLILSFFFLAFQFFFITTPVNAQIIPVDTINIQVEAILGGATSWHYKTATSTDPCDEAQYGTGIGEDKWVMRVDLTTSASNCWKKTFQLDDHSYSSNYTWQGFGGVPAINTSFLVTASHYVSAWTCTGAICKYFGPAEHEGVCMWQHRGTYNSASSNIINWIENLPTDTWVVFRESDTPPFVPYCHG